jgi:branched-chain amino acid transport system permease protein
LFYIQVLLNGVTAGVTLALVSIGLTLIFGVLGVVNFIHGVVFMLGAYATIYFAQMGGGYFGGLIGAAISTAVFGLIVAYFFLERFQGRFLEGAVFTVAGALFLESVAHELFGGAPRGIAPPFSGVYNINGLILNKHRLLVLVAGLLIVLAVHLYVKHSRFGRAMRALQQDPLAATLQGVRVREVSVFTFGLGSCLAGVAGGLVAPLQLSLPDMGVAPLLLAFVSIIAGGMGSIAGAFWMALCVGMIQSVVTSFWSPQAVIGVTFLFAMMVLVVRPTGLAGHDH